MQCHQGVIVMVNARPNIIKACAWIKASIPTIYAMHKMHICDMHQTTCTKKVYVDLNIDNFKTHWGRVPHICVSKLTIIGSDNSLSPDRRQAIIWTNDRKLLIGPLGTKFSEILVEILTFSFKKMHLKVSSAKWWPFCVGLNVLMVPDDLTLQGISWSVAGTLT